MKTFLKLFFGYGAILGTGLILTDIVSYFELLGADVMPIIKRGGNPWIVWLFTLPFTIYCIRFYFAPIKNSDEKA